MDNNTIKTSSNYDQFSFLDANREEYRGHVEEIKKSIEKFGDFTRLQPILVNEQLQIIDGQHRFLALKEMGLPINYTIAEGLGVNEARSMNILHRNWTAMDYARSYAKTGDPSYKKFLKMIEDYGFSVGTTIKYISNGVVDGQWRQFRNGEFVLSDEAGARKRLDTLASLGEYTKLVKDILFARALLIAMSSENYNHKRMVTKIKLFGGGMFRLNSLIDAERQLEDVYNHKARLDNRVRLF